MTRFAHENPSANGRVFTSATFIGTRLSDAARMRHWHALTPAEQQNAIRRLAADGSSDHGISQATGLSVEQIRRVLAERGAIARQGSHLMTPAEHVSSWRSELVADIEKARREVPALQHEYNRAVAAARNMRHPMRWADYQTALEQAQSLSLAAVTKAQAHVQQLEGMVARLDQLAETLS